LYFSKTEYLFFLSESLKLRTDREALLFCLEAEVEVNLADDFISMLYEAVATG
jgi:hypothetical protein